MRRRHLYEDEELDIEDQLDDIEDPDDDYEEPSINSSQIKSMVSSMVSREVDRLTRETPSTDSHRDTTEERTEGVSLERDTRSGHPEQHSPTQKPDQRKHTPIPHHSSPSYPTHTPSKKPHRPRGHKGDKRTIQRPKVLSRPHYNVVYHNLETINSYPNNNRGLVPFNNRIVGNFIIFSPITSDNFEPTKRMHDVFRFRKMCMTQKYKYLPIYSLNDRNIIIDKLFCIGI